MEGFKARMKLKRQQTIANETSKMIKVQKLKELGFNKIEATKALQAFKYDLSLAIDLLTDSWPHFNRGGMRLPCRMPSIDSVAPPPEAAAPPPLDEAPPPPSPACASVDAGDVHDDDDDDDDDDDSCDDGGMDPWYSIETRSGVYDTCPNHLMPWFYDDCHDV